jgi:tetratricopeptide (TPR) repeat protein
LASTDRGACRSRFLSAPSRFATESATLRRRDDVVKRCAGLLRPRPGISSFLRLDRSWRSFNQALRLDARLANGYLGLSYALGELGELEGLSQASRQASALADRVTDRERLRINLRVTQLIAAAQPDKPSLRSDYLKQFDQALTKYPKDVELLLLRGRTNDRTHEAPGMGSGEGSVTFYECALAQQPHYFATHHYLTHAYENLGRMDRALEHASEYARLAPAVPHAHHMYGHVLRRLNRIQGAIAGR